jgi:hypothetical protein
MSRRLPRNWQTLSLGALWERLNDPRRLTTPEAIIEAIMYTIRARGLAALKEPANRERLKRCDRAAREEINRRIAMLKQRAIFEHEPA